MAGICIVVRAGLPLQISSRFKAAEKPPHEPLRTKSFAGTLCEGMLGGLKRDGGS
jgi:hypothetical protein